jgi:CDP-2,3-bis-(O-geranylgeranyl)-sn-glycerol synthase
LIVDFVNIGYAIGALFTALWIMIPAYAPNPIAVVVGGGTPIDLGNRCRDGRRVLGDGKTYRGFFGGILGGILVGLLLIEIQGILGFSIHTPLSVVLLATGALIGDLVKSFFKRRLNKERGEEWLIADQYDLVAGAFAMVALFDLPWLIAHVSLAVGLWIIIATPLLHRGANIIGYLAGMKDVPW